MGKDDLTGLPKIVTHTTLTYRKDQLLTRTFGTLFCTSMKNIAIHILIFISLLFLSYSEAPAGQAIKIGLLTSPKENKIAGNKPYLRGAEVAVAELNSREGKEGIQFLLVLREGAHVKEKELNELRNLFVEERIDYLMGSVVKEALVPLSRLAQERRIPFFAYPTELMGGASTGEQSPNLFWISPAPEAFQRASVRTVSLFPQKRFFLLARDSNVGRSFAKYFWEEQKRLKPDMEKVGEAFLPEKVDDYGILIRELLTAKTEVCLSHLGVKEWMRFAKVARKEGYFKKIIHFELESGSLEALVGLGKEAPEGVWGISAFPFWGLGWKETKEFVAKYKNKTNSYPGLEALSGYVSIFALVEAMKKAGSFDPEKVIVSLKGLTFRTPIGSLAIRNTDNRALWPIWCGQSHFTYEYPFATLGGLKAFGPDSFAP